LNKKNSGKGPGRRTEEIQAGKVGGPWRGYEVTALHGLKKQEQAKTGGGGKRSERKEREGHTRRVVLKGTRVLLGPPSKKGKKYEKKEAAEGHSKRGRPESKERLPPKTYSCKERLGKREGREPGPEPNPKETPEGEVDILLKVGTPEDGKKERGDRRELFMKQSSIRERPSTRGRKRREKTKAPDGGYKGSQGRRRGSQRRNNTRSHQDGNSDRQYLKEIELGGRKKRPTSTK